MSNYELVKLANGACSIRSLAHGETFHPVIGPVAEAEALYVRQIRLEERLRAREGTFVVWDVGLGAAANVLTMLRWARVIPARIRILSFDQTIEPLRFALSHTDTLTYLKGYEPRLRELTDSSGVRFRDLELEVEWDLVLGDFPNLLLQHASNRWPKPHAILFDAYSPAKNPDMWTQPLFARILELLDPERPCLMPTYSRSTLLRVSLLLAGFYVGAGFATGEKEQTTIASNSLGWLDYPLDREWLKRARRSTSAEPLWNPVYRQAPLSESTWERLQRHPQFAGATRDQAAGAA